MEIDPYYTDTVMRQIVPNLTEGSYVFEMKTKGKNHLVSLTSIASGKAYGKEYQLFLNNRMLQSQTIQGGKLIMNWGTEENCVGLEMALDTIRSDKEVKRFPLE